MDWLFGCFGGVGKKARKHGDSQKVLQFPMQPLPVKVPTLSSVAAEAFAARKEETIQEGLLQERQSSGGSLARKAEDTLCQESSERTPEKRIQGEPWSQLEDLEEELESIRTQIEKETHDAKKIKEEVIFLRSCGTLLQTPAELRKENRPLSLQQGITPLKGWHSWLVPSSPTLKLQFGEPLKSQLAAEHQHINIPCDVQTPIIDNTRKEGNVQAASSSMLGQRTEEVVYSHFNLQNAVAAQQDVDVHDSGITSGDCKQGVVSLAKLHNETPMDDVSTTEQEMLLATSEAESRVLKLSNENAESTCENSPSNLERLETPTATGTAKEVEKSFTRLCQKRQAHEIDTVQAPFHVETANVSSRMAVLDAKGTPQSTNHRYISDESDHYASYVIPQCSSSSSSSGQTDDPGTMLKPSSSTSSSYHEHRAALEVMSHNKQDRYSGGGYKNDFGYDRHDDSQLDTLGSTSSSSMKSTDTTTDLSAENTFSPFEIRISLENRHKCNGEDFAAGFCVDETASKTLHSYDSTQHSVAQGGCRTTQAARYRCEYDEGKDSLSSDAISHASVECTKTSRVKQINGHVSRFFRPEDQNLIETPIRMSKWIATPEFQRSPKVRTRPSSPVLTPVENTLQWKQLKRVEDPSKMGLNLNAQGNKYNHNGTEAAYKNHEFSGIKASTATQRTGCIVAGTQEESWGENEHGVWTEDLDMCVCKEQGDISKFDSEKNLPGTNVSLSQWLTPSPEPSRVCGLVSPTPILRSYNMPLRLDAETASSLWTPMHANACRESARCAPEALPLRVDMSLSNWLDALSKQDQGRCSDVSPIELLRHGSHSGDPNERPILGITFSDNCLNSATASRVQWDGKGIPNTTSKYKEESRVSWHASPFEVRLERALNQQEEILTNMCFEVASSTPVSNRLKNLQKM